jgi:hypothetical protein
MGVALLLSAIFGVARDGAGRVRIVQLWLVVGRRRDESTAKRHAHDGADVSRS